MVKKFNNFLNEMVSPFEDEKYRKESGEGMLKAYRKHWLTELSNMDCGKSMEELESMDTQVLGNYYNYLYWNDEGYLDRPGMEEYKEYLKK